MFSPVEKAVKFDELDTANMGIDYVMPVHAEMAISSPRRASLLAEQGQAEQAEKPIKITDHNPLLVSLFWPKVN